MTEREVKIEADCVEWAVDRGWHELKIMRANRRGYPDRLFIRAGRVVFVEFKRLKGPAREQQRRRIRELIAAGVEAWFCDSRELFYARMA